MNRFTLSIALLSLSILSACSGGTETPVAYTPEWYRGSSVVSADGSVNTSLLDPDKIDLIYLVSTEVLSARDEEGRPLYQSTLSEEDRLFIDQELDYVARHYDQGDFNFLAPYYHQYTFEAILLPDTLFAATYEQVRQEVFATLDYYLEHINHGRRFALVGFSQGAMLTADVLKHFSSDQLRNMVGAYLLGFGLNEEDLACPNIIPATGEEGFGHTITFNSVMNAEATWPWVHNQAATAINPVNWRTDDLPALFTFYDDTLSVRLDTTLHELIVTIPDPKPFHDFILSNPAYKMAGISPDCLHRWDLLFYSQQIHDNILRRNRPL